MSLTKLLTATYIFTSISCAMAVKPRSIFLDKELLEAKYIDVVIIKQYKDKNILFSALYNTDTTLSAAVPDYVRKNGDNSSNTTTWTGHWPNESDTVLIVINNASEVLLFAKEQNDYYRFWSPYITGSEALFYYKRPAINLPNEEEKDALDKSYKTCWDGCLFPKEKLVLQSENLVEKWYIIDNVGYNIVNKVYQEELKEENIKKCFVDSFPHLSANWFSTNKLISVDEIIKQYEVGKEDGFFRSYDSKKPYAEVEKFTKKQVVINIIQEVGASRWHHSLYCYKRYIMYRNNYIDSIFGLDEMELKFSLTYQGVVHGMSLEDLIKKLGRADYEYEGQSPSLQEFFYANGNLYVRVNNYKVYYLKQYKDMPDFIKNANSEYRPNAWMKKK